MHLVTTGARLRTLGILLLEIAGIALVIAERLGHDPELRASITGVLKKVRAL